MAQRKQTLQSNGQVRGVDVERHTVTCVVSTGDVARDGAAINPMGWTTDNYLKNPVVLFGHDISRLPVGRTIDLQMTGNELIATAEFDMANEDAAELFNSIARGFLRGTSVRWTPIRTSVKRIGGKEVLYFEEQDLVEWSFTPVPVDPNSLVIRSIEGDELKIEDFVSTEDDISTQTDETAEATPVAGVAVEEDVLTSDSKAAFAAEAAQADTRATLLMAVATYLASNN